MPNPYYDHTTYPAPNAPGSSAALRAELDLIETGFDKLPTLSGNANKAVVVNAGETALTATSTLTGLTFSSPVITGGTINNTVIGGTTPANGTFTALAATTATVGGVNVVTESATQTLTNKTFNLANNTFVGTSAQLAAAITDESGTGSLLFANSPAMTGTPTAPTAAVGTSTTQLATTAFVAATAFSTSLPGQTGNAGKFVTTDGTNASWADPLPSQTGNAGKYLTTNGTAASWSALTGQGGTTASGSVVLTAASVGAQSITPTDWGQSVTLPDATTCTLGAQLFSIRNAGDYDLKILDASGVCIGFIRPSTTVDIGLAAKATAAGTWVLNGEVPIGTTAVTSPTSAGYGSVIYMKSLAVDADRDLILFSPNVSAGLYGIVYNKTTRAWGSVTLIRSAAWYTWWDAIKTATDQFLAVSCNNGTAYEAVVLTLSGTSISVGTAATATLGSSPTVFGNNYRPSGIALVGSSVVISYALSAASTPAIRAMTISGTTVTIGSEVALPGSLIAQAPIYAVSSTVLLTFSETSPAGTLYAKCFTVSGTTITGASQATATVTANGFYVAPFGSAWALVYRNSQTYAGIATVSGSTPTLSTALLTTSSNTVYWSVGASKVMVFQDTGTNSLVVNTFTNNAGTVSVGTSATQGTGNGGLTNPALWAVDANTFHCLCGAGAYVIDASGTNPVVTRINQPSVTLNSAYSSTGSRGEVSGFLYKSKAIGINVSSSPILQSYICMGVRGLFSQGSSGSALPSNLISNYESSSAAYFLSGFSSSAGNSGGTLYRVEVAQ